MTARRSILLISCACLSACAKPEPPPAAHIAVSETVKHFAPGLQIGQTLSQSTVFVRNHRWVPHAGVVGVPPRRMFQEARVFPGDVARAAASMDPDAFVHAVELVNDGSHERMLVMPDLAIAFRAIPKHGCLAPLDSGGPYRSVTYWLAPGEAGGAAVLEEWGDTPMESHQRVLWSLFVWGGPFRSAETFFAPFTPGFCERGDPPAAPPGIERTLAAVEALQQAFAQTVRGVRQSVVEARAYEMSNVNPLDPCMFGTTAAATRRWELDGVTLELPTDLEEEEGYGEAERRAMRQYTWRGPDGTRVTIRPGPDTVYEHGVGGSLVAHCTEPTGARIRDIDLFNLSVGYPDLRVNAKFPARDAGLTFEGIARTRERQEQLLRAAHSIQVSRSWRAP
jgi:hypothetical protein